MSESRFSLESELPCVHCGTPLDEACRFCFECGAPVVPALDLPAARGAIGDHAQVAISAPSSDPGLTPGVLIEIESLAFDVVVEEVPIDFDDLDADPADSVADPHGTVIAMAPERPMPYWPAPPKGGTVVAPAPTRHRSRTRAAG